MSAVSRVSAFAKRRRLDDDIVARTSESDGSSTVSLAKEAKSKKIATRQTDIPKDIRRTLSRNDVDPIDGRKSSSENSFEPLVNAKAVSFIGTREIEHLDGSGCRIRLSKGQRCSLYGIARLWVREGTVCVDGALIDCSVHVYTVFSSAPGSFTDIIAESKIVEFQLDNIQAPDDPLPSVANVPGKLAELAKHGMVSFRVLGQVHGDDVSSLQTTSDIDTQIQRGLSPVWNAMHMKIPQILICGKRSPDTYRTSISLVNYLLTHSSKRLVSSTLDEVAFLDLDFISPAFSAPGTISIASLRKPVLGPSYTQPLQQYSEWFNKLVAVQYVGAVETSGTPKLDPNCINTLLSMAKEAIKNKLLVVRTGSWLAYMTQTERYQLQKLLRVGLAICVDANKASPHYEAAQTFSERTSLNGPDTFFHLQISPSATSSLSEHKLMLQSHFRLCKLSDGGPLWYHDSIPDMGDRRLVLSTSESENEIRFLQVRGGMLRPQDIPNAIHQNLVVIVAISTSKKSVHLTSGHYQDLGQSLSDRHDSAQPLLELREVDDAQILHYIGLAYVESIETQTRSITLNTSVSIDDIQRQTFRGHEVGLVLEKPGTDGRFGRSLLFS